MTDKLIDPAQLGEAIHTAFRKAIDHPNAAQIHRLINELPPEEWGRIVDWIADAAGFTPTVLVIQHDLLQILAGDTMTVGTRDDQEVRVRMYTADEFVAHQHALVDANPEMGGSKIGREQAEDQTRRWDLEEMLLGRHRLWRIGRGIGR